MSAVTEISEGVRLGIRSGRLPFQASYYLVKGGAGNTDRPDEDEKRQIMDEYALAYEQANSGSRATILAASPGWYKIVRPDGYPSRRNHRLREIAQMTLRLVERAHGGG